MFHGQQSQVLTGSGLSDRPLRAMSAVFTSKLIA